MTRHQNHKIYIIDGKLNISYCLSVKSPEIVHRLELASSPVTDERENLI